MKWVCAAIVLLPVTAEAGVLAKVLHGMQQKAGATDRGDGTNADGDGSSASHDASDFDAASHCGSCADDPTAPIVASAYPYYPYAGPEHFEVYLGLHSVEDSDGAFAFAARSTVGDVGFGFTDTSYFERIPTVEGQDTLRLDVWDVALSYRVLHTADRRTQVWVSGGMAGASSDDLELYGATAGVRVTHDLARNLGAEVSARALRLQHDIDGTEWRAGVAASILRASYRHMKFDVGPALKGPELGIAWSF